MELLQLADKEEVFTDSFFDMCSSRSMILLESLVTAGGGVLPVVVTTKSNKVSVARDYVQVDYHLLESTYQFN